MEIRYRDEIGEVIDSTGSPQGTVYISPSKHPNLYDLLSKNKDIRAEFNNVLLERDRRDKVIQDAQTT